MTQSPGEDAFLGALAGLQGAKVGEPMILTTGSVQTGGELATVRLASGGDPVKCSRMRPYSDQVSGSTYSPVYPVAGDTVWVAVAGTQALILGKV